MKRVKTGFALVALLTGMLAVDRYRSQRDEIARLRAELDTVQAQQVQLAALAQRIPVAIRAPALARAVEPGATGSAIPEPSSHDSTSDHGTPAERWEAESQANLASIDDLYAAQAQDDSWATATRTTLLDRLAVISRSTVSRIESLSCRTSVCRMELACRDIDSLQSFTEQAFVSSDQAWDGPIISKPPQITADGSLKVVVYLGKEGTSLLGAGLPLDSTTNRR